jgi:hypothetical protein
LVTGKARWNGTTGMMLLHLNQKPQFTAQKLGDCDAFDLS